MTPPSGLPIATASTPPSLTLQPDEAEVERVHPYVRRVLFDSPFDLDRKRPDDRAFAAEVLQVAVELVDNAIVHGGEDELVKPGIPMKIHLSLQARIRGVLVGVSDPWKGIPRSAPPGSEPQENTPVQELKESGRGLMIVDAFAKERWVEFRETGKTVYALVLHPAPESVPNEPERRS